MPCGVLPRLSPIRSAVARAVCVATRPLLRLAAPWFSVSLEHGVPGNNTSISGLSVAQTRQSRHRWDVTKGAQSEQTVDTAGLADALCATFVSGGLIPA